MGRQRVIGVEGQSAARYIRAAIKKFAPHLSVLADRVEDWGDLGQIEKRLEEYNARGEKDFVFLVWDHDVQSRPGKVPSPQVIDHPYRFTFHTDFEEVFPDWMVAEALAVYDARAGYPDEVEIRDNCRVPGSQKSFYERLRDCVKAHAREPASIELPDKVPLAECLAKVASRTWYQPEEIRRLLNLLGTWSNNDLPPQNLIQNGKAISGFLLNVQAIKGLGIRGKVAVSVLQDLWIIDLEAMAAKKAVSDIVAGPPSWSHDGSRIAFPSTPSQPVYNNEAIRVYSVGSGLGPERLSIGGHLCWDSGGRIYGNSNGWESVCAVNPTDGSRRNLRGLPKDSIAVCVDRVDRRDKDRILIGESGLGLPRVCSIFAINNGGKVWDGCNVKLRLAEYSAGAFSPDGQRVTWPVEEGGGGSRTLLVTHLADSKSVRLTPRDGNSNVQSSCWSPDGTKVAFMWSRWARDPIRMWVVDMNSRQLEPLIEGFGDASINALGCHSWAKSQ